VASGLIDSEYGKHSVTFSGQQLQKDDRSSTRQEVPGRSNFFSFCASYVIRRHEQLSGLSVICSSVDSQYLLLCSHNTKVNMRAALPIGTQLSVGTD